MNYARIIASAIFVVCGAASVAAQPGTSLTPDQVNWRAVDDAPGWQHAVLAGDPTKPGPFVERFKIPPNATTPLHTHPNTENITVLAGSFGLAENSTFDKSSGKILPAGSFYLLPPNQAHFAWSGADGAIIQIHGVGPSGMAVLHAPPQEESTKQ